MRLLRFERLQLRERELELLLKIVSLENHVLQAVRWLAHDDGLAQGAIIGQVNDVCWERIAAGSLRLQLLIDCLFVRLLLDEQILHIIDKGTSRLLFSDLQRQPLQLGEIAFSHIYGVLVRLQQGLERRDGVRLLLAVLQLLINYALVHLFEEQDLTLQLILLFPGLLEVGVKLLVLLYQYIFQFFEGTDCLLVSSGFFFTGYVYN